MNLSITEKSIADILLEKFRTIFRLGRFRAVINNMISSQYVSAIEKVDNDLDLTINLVPKSKDITFLQDYVDGNIEAASDAISNQLRQEIQRGIMNNETTTELSKRVKKLFKTNQYQKRLKVIIRTETSRANNQGTLDAAKQAVQTGVKLEKWLDVIEDARTSNVCRAEHSKYGTPDKSIPIDQEFVVRVDNKTIRAQAPPFLPNCRTSLRIKVIK